MSLEDDWYEDVNDPASVVGGLLRDVVRSREELIAENTLTLVRLTKLLAASSLFQALGGGWTPEGTLSVLQP